MRKEIRVLILGLLCVGWVQQLFAQVTVTNSNNPNFLAKKLIGPGVEVSNASMLCNPNQSAFFVSPSGLLNMDSGIVLTTGLAATNSPYWGLNGPQSGFANQNQGTGGDVDLNALAGLSTFDRCILEFDFKGDGDTIFFEYRFGSEEYPSFNCTNYNDVFGFFISGPGITGSQNLALIPNTSIPVAINSVNNGIVIAGGNIANCTAMGAGSPFTQYYVNNTGGTILTYDGFTTMFKAKSYIQACSTYHIKLAIADGFDQIFDSGVFLKAGSFKSNTYHMSLATDSISSNPPYAFEGCDSIVLRIKRDNFQTAVNTDTLTLQIAGSATNGVDYSNVLSNYIFSSSLTDTMKTVYITPFNDLITEGTESIKFYLKNKCNTVIDSLQVDIKDPPTFSLFNSDTSICIGQGVQMNGLYDNGLSFSWSPVTGVSNPNSINTMITPAATTSYTLTAQYGNCLPVKDTITIHVESLPTISLSSTSVTCNSLGNGTITAFGTAGSSPLTFTIFPIGTILIGSPSTFTNLGPGTYTVTVSSGLGCTKSSTKIITEPSTMNWISVSPTNIGCNAGNVGLISAGASGGTGIISYTLNPGNVNSSSGNFSGLGPGVYIVTAKDANNCTITSNVTITQANSLSWFLVNSTNVSCNGQANGSIFTSASGGTGTITYQILPGGTINTSGNFPTLSAGSFTVTATDATGCTATTSITLTQPATGITLGTPNVTNATCWGTSTGAVSISASGGNGTLTYLLNPPGSSNTAGVFTGKPAGNYTITVSDANGCTVTTTFVITQPSAININTNNIYPTCVPGNNGSMSITATGGAGGYQYKLNTGSYQASNTFSGLTSANYTITVKDMNNCTSAVVVPLLTTNVITLSNNTLPMACSTTVVTINVVANGGTSPYSFNLQPNNITNSTGQFPGVDTGSYIVTVTDVSGCTNALSINIVQPPSLIWGNFNITNIPCSGIGSGNVAVAAMGGTPVYTYSIQPPGTTNTSGIFNNLGQNWYTVTATDANGCSATSLAQIVISPALALAPPNITPVSCFGTNTGSLTINPIGGSLPMVYTLNPGNILNLTGTFNNLASGTYTVSVLDAGNCTNSTTLTITQPAVLQISSITTLSPTCVPPNNGSITVNVNGGTAPYNYTVNGSWQASNTISGLVVGNYTVTVKDANNCTKSSIVNLINPAAPTFSSVNVSQALCAGSATGNLSININSGTAPLTYIINPLGISNTSGIFNNLPVSTYTITVTDAVNCVITTTANVLQPSAVQWSNVSSNNVQCNGVPSGSIQVSANGGVGTIQYTVNPGALNNTTGVFNTLTNATYTVVATDANSCSISTIINITQPSALFWSGVTSSNAACYNLPTANINAGANGGSGILSYTLQPGNLMNTNGNYPNIMSGIYTVQVTDANGCTLSSVFNLTQPSSALSVNISNTIPTCVPGNDATITVLTSGGTPGYLYSINGMPNQSSNVFTSIGISNYTVVVSDANGCTISSLVPVANNNAPNITSVNTTNILCFGNTNGSIITNVSGGSGILTYSLQPSATNNNNGIFINLAASSYTVSVSDANNCVATSNVILVQPPILMWDSVDNRDVACYGGGNGVVTSSASGGAGSIVYHLMPINVTNLNGIFFGLGVGQYTLTATDANGCSVNAVFQINQPPPISWTSVSVTPVSCNPNTDGSVYVLAAGGNGNFDYKLLPNNVTNVTGSFTNLPTGTYTVIASDFLNCTLTTVVNITTGPPVVITNTLLTPASCIPGCDGGVTLNAAGGNGIYTYSNNNSVFQSSGSFASLCSGIYTVIAKDINNCSATATYTISTANGPAMLNMSSVSVSCFGGSNGQLNANTSGGVGPYTYLINPGGVTNSSGAFSSLTAQMYTVTTTDANGCSISAVASVSQPNLFEINSAVSSPVFCNGGSNGGVVLTTTGGNGSPQYVLLPNNVVNTTGNFTGLSAGNYTVNVTDINGCSSSTNISVNEPASLQFTMVNTTNVSCNGGGNGIIQSGVSGGNGGNSFTLLPGNINNSTGLFSLLAPGNYTIQVTDANGCTLSTTSTINQPPPISWTTVSLTPVSCNPNTDGSISVQAAGGNGNFNYLSLPNNVTNVTGSFTNLPTGTYTVIASDFLNCTLTTVVNITTGPPVVITNTLLTPASCIPGCDGGVTLNAAGGNGIYTYSNNNSVFQSSGSFASLCSGVYTVIAKDVNNCSGTATYTISTTNGPAILNMISVSVSCFGGSNGQLNANTAGGVGPYAYHINPGGVTNSSGTFSGLTAQMYTVTTTDANGCSISAVASVSQPNFFEINSAVSSPVSCNGGSNGGVVLTTTGGNGSPQYVLLPNNVVNTTGNFTGLSAGNYTVNVTDINGCSSSTNISVNEPASLQFTMVNTTNVSCNGGSNGIIQSGVSGGNGGNSFTLLPGNINNSTGVFSLLAPGNYTIQVMDANGCTLSTTSSINQPTPLVITNISTTIPTCVPGGDASLTISASGATPMYTYSINGGSFQPLNLYNNLSVGLYTVVVMDANNCTTSSVSSITSPFSPIISGMVTTTATCDPGCDGTSLISATNGTSPYTYSLNSSAFQSSGLFTGLCINNYTVVVKDVNGCTGSGIFMIINPPSPIVTGIISISASCNPGCDGSLTMNTTGGTGTPSYSLNNSSFQLSNVFSNLCSGLYTLTVKDAVGCTNDNLAMVNTFTGPVIISTSSTNVSCYAGNNGSLSLSVSGGTAPINYILLPNNITNTSAVFNNLSAGIYTVNGTDAHGCTLSSVVSIIQPALLQFGSITTVPVTCFGSNNGIINCPVIGGSGVITYSISPSGIFTSPFSFTGLSGGIIYSITATDANGCTTTTSQSMAQPSPVQINSLSFDSVTCNGWANAHISCSASGGTGALSYTLMPGGSVNASGHFNNLSGGNYTITVADVNNCTATTTAFIFEPTALQIINSSSSNLTCNGLTNGSVNVSATGGTLPLQYYLAPGGMNNTTGSFVILPANTYTITIVDGNACTLTTSLTVIEPAPVLLTTVVTTHVSCFGLSNGQIAAGASGGVGTLSYLLMPGNITNTSGQFNGLNVNLYTVQVMDVNGCSTSTTINLTQPQPLNLTLDSLHNISCFGGNNGFISGHATGGTLNYVYSLLPNNISNSNGIFSGLTANTHTLIVTDAQGCTDSIFPLILAQPPQIVFTSVSHEDITCYFDTTGSITVTAAGGTGNLSFSLLPNAGLQLIPGHFQNLGANSYTVVATDAINCSVTTLVNVIQNLQIQAQVQFTEPVCFGESNGVIEISAVGGVPPLTYSLNGGPFLNNGIFGNLTAGTYSIEIVDSKNCVADTILTLTQPDKVGALLDINHTICVEEMDGSVKITGTGGRGDYVYYLKPGVNINQNGFFGGLSSGTYTVTVKDSSLCQYDTLMTILPPANLMSVTFDKKDVGCYGYGNDAWIQSYVTGGTGPYTYSWNDPAQSKTDAIDHLRWGVYQLDITDSNGCRIQDTVQIHPGICCDEVFIPSAFSPNNDNLNDCWRIAIAAGIELRQLAVFNRWGNKLWDANDVLQCWDGSYNGKRCEVSTYYYILRYKCLSDGKEYVKKGDITLVE